jgi:hypothetical protein
MNRWTAYVIPDVSWRARIIQGSRREGIMTLDGLEKEIRDLSDADFARLARRLGYDAPRYKYAEVIIDDGDGDDPPVAIIEYADGSKHRVDIFTAIRENSPCVGNPIVLIAIHHWQQIIRHRTALTFKDVWESKEGEAGIYVKGIREYYSSSLPERASKNLSRVSEALIDAAKESGISREKAFVACVTRDGYDTKDTFLYIAYEWLRKNPRNNKGLKLNELEEALRKEHAINNCISVSRVIDFLRSEKGQRHINPMQWISMRNAYLAWYFELDQKTVTTYLRRGRDKTDNKVDTGYFHPRFKRYPVSEIGEILMRYAVALPAEAYLKADKADEADEDFGQLGFGE